jgi:hypothetical protein
MKFPEQPKSSEHCIVTLTPDDVDRIEGLLSAVQEAITELIAYRCVRPLDVNTSFSLEDEVYKQTSQILIDCAPSGVDHF